MLKEAVKENAWRVIMIQTAEFYVKANTVDQRGFNSTYNEICDALENAAAPVITAEEQIEIFNRMGDPAQRAQRGE